MLCQILCVCVCVCSVVSQYLHAKTHSKTKRGQDVSGAGLCAHVRASVCEFGTNRPLSLLAVLSRQLAEQLKKPKDPTKHHNNTGNRTHTVTELHFLCLQFQDVNL